MTTAIDFQNINAAARAAYRTLLPVLLPGGKFRGPEYVCTNPRRNDKSPGSFSVNFVKGGLWKDFATGDGGSDFISLVAYVKGLSQGDAARELAEMLGVPLLKPNGVAANGHANAHQSAPKITPAPDGPKLYQWGNDGPPKQSDELRRHVYLSAGCARKIKVKRSNGEFKQWFRSFDAGGVPIGWQDKKPDDYVAIPYLSAAIDPFDPS